MAIIRTYSRFKKHGFRLLLTFAAVVVFGLCVFAFNLAGQENARLQGAESIKAAIVDNARQCAAIEGAYPPSLKYLEDHYGLVLDHNNYKINYEVFAQNVMPTVSVVPR